MPAPTILILHAGKEIGVNGGIATQKDHLGEGIRQLHPLLGGKDLICRLEGTHLGSSIDATADLLLREEDRRVDHLVAGSIQGHLISQTVVTLQPEAALLRQEHLGER